MSENLKLPICPKCNDTKSVYELPAVRLIPSYSTEYGCSECKIKWYTVFERGYIAEQDEYDLMWAERVKS
jgi:hypothetical protein